MVTLSFGICHHGFKLFSQFSAPRVSLGETAEIQFRTKRPEQPATGIPSRSRFVHTAFIELFGNCHQGDTADLGWILVVEEFGFTKASENHDSASWHHKHYPS